MDLEFDTLDENSALVRTELVYPYLMVDEPSDAVALIVPCLEEGDLPVLCKLDDTVYHVANISSSALVLHKLLRISKLTYNKSATERVPIVKPQDIMNIYGG